MKSHFSIIHKIKTNKINYIFSELKHKYKEVNFKGFFLYLIFYPLPPTSNFKRGN